MASVVGLLFAVPLACCAAEHGYLGGEVCAGCHKQIAAAQAGTAMARTWQGSQAQQLPADYSEAHAEGPEPVIDYVVKRAVHGLEYVVQMPNRQPVKFPVQITMGGERHGLSFLVRVADIEGSSLPRAPLVETRYLHDAPQNRLALSPGFPLEKPSTYETALGRVLSPQFEKKCLTCHGEPRDHSAHPDRGVTCENCHGPGQPHLLALSRKSPDVSIDSVNKGILNPAKLPIQEQMQPCSPCHAGFSNVVDPMPDDLLISDQVTALSNSECWRQTAGRITCTNCHNPHQDARRAVLVARSEKTCLACHTANVRQHPALCPLNRSTGCVGCHMPEVTDQPPFAISDHWIRVHPEQNVRVTENLAAWRSTVSPKHLYLRMITMDDPSKAESIRQQLLSGASFFDLARANSSDASTAVNGGFLGDLDAGQLDPAWSKAALALQPGEISGIIEVRGKYVILQRMPRNFREEAELRFNKAMELRKQEKRDESVRELLEALKIYPRLLRALTYLGVTYGEAGNPQTGAAILTMATRLYPQDAGAHFNLGIADGALGKQEEIAEYKRALEINPDLVLAYLNLGAALYAKGEYENAIQVYREGINVNPLVASLHYSLSIALQQRNDTQTAKDELALAVKIDPTLAKR
jgi:predicted CXXCH cytochrome family protein